MRFLAIDLGDKRTGLALGDAITRVVSALEVVEVARDAAGGSALLDAIVRAVADQLGSPRKAASPLAAGGLVVGLPLNMDGSEGPRAKIAREFGAAIAARTGHHVWFQDERLTSAQADWDMSQSGMTRGEKKKRRDALAASALLSDFLAQSARSSSDSDAG